MTGRDPDAVGAALGRFAELLGGEHPDADPLPVPPLDEAALAIANVLQPHLDRARWLSALDDLAASCPGADREAIAEHLFRSGHLRGDRDTYAIWRFSCLDQVLDRGRGIPITLAVVAIEVARRLDVPLVGVGMPAHFLVGDPADPEWFLDPFHGGRILDRDGCHDLFTEVTGGDERWNPAYLQPTPTRAIVVRMLNNLRANFTRQPDRVRLALVMRMRFALPELGSEAPMAARAMAVFN